MIKRNPRDLRWDTCTIVWLLVNSPCVHIEDARHEKTIKKIKTKLFYNILIHTKNKID